MTNKTIHRPILLPVLLALLTAGLAACDTAPKRSSQAEQAPLAKFSFSEQDRALIHEYYAREFRNLPPKVAQVSRLPAGHHWRLRKDSPLVAGIPWRELPSALDDQLTPLPPEFLRIVVGDQVAILRVSGQMIVDLVDNTMD